MTTARRRIGSSSVGLAAAGPRGLPGCGGGDDDVVRLTRTETTTTSTEPTTAASGTTPERARRGLAFEIQPAGRRRTADVTSLAAGHVHDRRSTISRTSHDFHLSGRGRRRGPTEVGATGTPSWHGDASRPARYHFECDPRTASPDERRLRSHLIRTIAPNGLGPRGDAPSPRSRSSAVEPSARLAERVLAAGSQGAAPSPAIASARFSSSSR